MHPYQVAHVKKVQPIKQVQASRHNPKPQASSLFRSTRRCSLSSNRNKIRSTLQCLGPQVSLQSHDKLLKYNIFNNRCLIPPWSRSLRATSQVGCSPSWILSKAAWRQHNIRWSLLPFNNNTKHMTSWASRTWACASSPFTSQMRPRAAIHYLGYSRSTPANSIWPQGLGDKQVEKSWAVWAQGQRV